MKKILIAIIILSAALYAEPTIDSVWFSQDTICDGQNLVEICYILSGGTAQVSALMSADSGETWTVPMDSLIGAETSLGFDIVPGTHCFTWVMSHDLPDTHGTDWIVRVEVVDILDTFLVIDSIWVPEERAHYGWGLAFGLGVYWFYDFTTGYVYYSNGINPTTHPPRDSVYIGDSLNMDIDFYNYSIYFARGGSNPTHIYRKALFTGDEQFIAEVPMHGSAVQGVQVIRDTLYAAYYDNRGWVWIGGSPVFINRMYLLAFDLSQPFPITEWDTVTNYPRDSCHTIEGMAYAHGYLWGSNNWGRIVQIDFESRDYVGCYPVPNVGNGAEGLCWDGEYLWYHNREHGELHSLYQILIHDMTSSRGYAGGLLDSRGPIVNIMGPDSVLVGESYNFRWTATDPSGIVLPYEVVTICGAVIETLFVSDPRYVYTIPSGCDTVQFSVSAVDSFCNEGSDILSVPVASAGLIGHIFIQGEEGIYSLRVIDQADAIAAGNGVIMIQMPGVIGAAELVDTTHTNASPVFINTPYGIRSWRYDSIITD
ncbi:MAG TPA: hypothetical protein ENN07_01370 [candidate division Zixibacteria bacterium]|nr:hypothetical protein [candidate division Zixibacteria bacterium]